MKTAVQSEQIQSNLLDYDSFYHSFNWQNERNNLDGLPNDKGLNIAHKAVLHIKKSLAYLFSITGDKQKQVEL